MSTTLVKAAPAPLDRHRPAWSSAAHAVGWYAAARLTGLLVAVVAAAATGRSPRTVLGASWDSLHYLSIAAHGYRTWYVTGSGLTYSDLAFFPLYPALIRAGSAVLPLSPVDTALLISAVAGCMAAWGIHAVVRMAAGPRTATGVVVLWALLPHAVVLNTAYTEALFVALCAWALHALLRERYLLAGGLAVAAGLTRPSGLAVIAAVITAAVLARRDRRAWAGALIAPLGWLAHVAWAGVRTGRPLGYLDIQSKWGSHFDFGHGTLRFAAHLLLTREQPLFYGAMLMVAAAVVAFFLLVRGARRQPGSVPLVLLVYTAVLLALAVGQTGNWGCKARMLLPAFPLLLPAAAVLCRARRTAAYATVTVLAVVSVTYGAYLVVFAGKPL
ncbi:hypothetical protein [Streptomyces mesophilus]|uniref:hypothetical protein n=1 Tax=Streptomyces mesophilus TaxID=1775132 RepID=UPI003333DF43